jgi:hypothetical protein
MIEAMAIPIPSVHVGLGLLCTLGYLIVPLLAIVPLMMGIKRYASRLPD